MLKKNPHRRRRDHHRLVVVVALQPATYRVTRTAAISAPAADVFAQVTICINSPIGPPGQKSIQR